MHVSLLTLLSRFVSFETTHDPLHFSSRHFQDKKKIIWSTPSTLSCLSTRIRETSAILYDLSGLHCSCHLSLVLRLSFLSQFAYLIPFGKQMRNSFLKKEGRTLSKPVMSIKEIAFSFVLSRLRQTLSRIYNERGI